jgi:hypothetical protein
MPSRWDLLLDRKPIPLVEHLLDEVSRLVANDLGKWPLPIQETVEPGDQFAGHFAPDAPRPPPAVFEEAFRIARWELEREFEAIDDYMRNHRWSARGLPASDKSAILLVCRWLVEQLLSLREYTQNRITRPMLVDCLGRIERRLRASGALS